MIKKITVIFLLMMTILIFGSSFSFAFEEKGTQIVLVLVNRLSFADGAIYKDTIGFQSLEKSAAKGAMNINTAGTRNDSNEYLTLSAGTRASTRDFGESFMGYERFGENGKVKAAEVYYQQTGIKVPDQLILSLPLQRSLQESNQKFPFLYGRTGKLLKEVGLSARVYGNLDTDTPRRYAPLITMDQNGQSSGDVGKSVVTSDIARPFGIKTNYGYLYQCLINDLQAGISLIVVDLGDLYRLDQFKEQMSPSQYEIIRKIVIREQGQFLNQTLKVLNHRQQLLALAPMVSDQAIKDRQLLAPFWWYQPTGSEHYVSSGTTKRQGIISNIDVIPTVLSQLGVKNGLSDMTGREIKRIKTNISFEQRLDQIFTVYRQRSPILYSYVLWQVIILLLSIFVWIFRWSKVYFLLRMSLLSILILPILILLSSPLYFLPSLGYLFSLLITSLILSVIIKSVDSLRIFIIIGCVTWIGITLDVWLGSPFMKTSYLGYDPIIGARYYGMGNEYMGVYIGAALLFTSSWIQRRCNRWTMGLTALICGITIYLLLSPTLGTNAGGAIAALFATCFTFLKMNHIKLARKGFWIFILFICIGLLLLIWMNLIVPTDQQSHIGRAINTIRTGNYLSIYQLIQRKLAMNWKLIRVSSWSKVMATSLFVIGILFIRPRGTLKNFYAQFPYLFYGFYGIVIGAITALLVNDSGIVAASTMIIYVASPMLYLALKEK